MKKLIGNGYMNNIGWKLEMLHVHDGKNMCRGLHAHTAAPSIGHEVAHLRYSGVHPGKPQEATLSPSRSAPLVAVDARLRWETGFIAADGQGCRSRTSKPEGLFGG